MRRHDWHLVYDNGDGDYLAQWRAGIRLGWCKRDRCLLCHTEFGLSVGWNARMLVGAVVNCASGVVNLSPVDHKWKWNVPWLCNYSILLPSCLASWQLTSTDSYCWWDAFQSDGLLFVYGALSWTWLVGCSLTWSDMTSAVWRCDRHVSGLTWFDMTWCDNSKGCELCTS